MRQFSKFSDEGEHDEIPSRVCWFIEVIMSGSAANAVYPPQRYARIEAMLNRLGGAVLFLLMMGIPAAGSDSKMLPACASTLHCEIDPQGLASCALGEFQSAQCMGRLAATVMTWMEVTASTDGLVTRELIHTERREWPWLKSHRTAAAQAIAAEPFDFGLRAGQDIEVQLTLLDPSGTLLWSSRLFLLSDEAGFRTSLNHPAMEGASTTHHVAFEKERP